ncbi:unnamed protein product [Calicophoron daubneyi]
MYINELVKQRIGTRRTRAPAINKREQTRRMVRNRVADEYNNIQDQEIMEAIGIAMSPDFLSTTRAHSERISHASRISATSRRRASSVAQRSRHGSRISQAVFATRDINKLKKWFPQNGARFVPQSFMDELVVNYVVSRHRMVDEVSEHEVKRVRRKLVDHILRKGSKNFIENFEYPQDATESDTYPLIEMSSRRNTSEPDPFD